MIPMILLMVLFQSLLLYAQSVTVKDYIGLPVPISEFKNEEAGELFNRIKSWDYMPFYYAEDACDARAYEIGYQLEKEKIEIGKIFVEGTIWVKTPFAEGGEAGWWFHVAPVIFVKEGKKSRSFVIDPTMNPPALILEKDWLKKLKAHKKSKIERVFYKNRFHYDPATRDMDLKTWDANYLEKSKSRLALYLPISKLRGPKMMAKAKTAPMVIDGAMIDMKETTSEYWLKIRGQSRIFIVGKNDADVVKSLKELGPETKVQLVVKGNKVLSLSSATAFFEE